MMKKFGRESPNLRDRILIAGSLVHADIIYQHSLREDGTGVWISGPVASHRDIQQQKKRVIEYPLPAGTKIGSSASDVEIIVDIEADGVGLPLDGEDMKVIGKSSFLWQAVGSFDSNAAGVTRPVNRAVDNRRFLANVFHDVDLATGRPTCFVDVIAQHPERWPHALARRNFDACFEAPVRLRKLSRSLHPG